MATLITQETTSQGGRRRRTGGQLALSGFLFQILRSLQLGMSLSVTFAIEGGDVSAMTLTLEPDDSGDLRVEERGVPTIEQVKIRSSNRSWSAGAFARDVLPDLITGSRPGTLQNFQFTTAIGAEADIREGLVGTAAIAPRLPKAASLQPAH